MAWKGDQDAPAQAARIIETCGRSEACRERMDNGILLLLACGENGQLRHRWALPVIDGNAPRVSRPLASTYPAVFNSSRTFGKTMLVQLLTP